MSYANLPVNANLTGQLRSRNPPLRLVLELGAGGELFEHSQ